MQPKLATVLSMACAHGFAKNAKGFMGWRKQVIGMVGEGRGY